MVMFSDRFRSRRSTVVLVWLIPSSATPLLDNLDFLISELSV